MPGIDKKILEFFTLLKKNNNRNWFEDNKTKFKLLEKEVKAFMIEVESRLQKHDEIQTSKLFRIYRDIRFSKNKTPYKTHFGIAYQRKKPLLRGGYYIHLEPKKSFLGVGFWGPNSLDLSRIRKELEIDADEFRKLTNNLTFKNYWGNLTGDEVKTAPKGFKKDHTNIDLIKKKQYVFIKKFTDNEVIDNNFSKIIDEYFIHIRPFFDYMSSVLTTDLNGEYII